MQIPERGQQCPMCGWHKPFCLCGQPAWVRWMLVEPDNPDAKVTKAAAMQLTRWFQLDTPTLRKLA